MHPGMRLGEALARCPRLALVPPDPVGVADAWERVLTRLEAVGAAVESERPGRCLLRGARPAAPARRLARRHRRRGARRAARARRGSAPGRRASARWPPPTRARTRRAELVARRRRTCASSPSRCCAAAPRSRTCRRQLEQLGITTLGALAALPRARGRRPLRPGRACSRTSSRTGATRRCARASPASCWRRRWSSPESASGAQLERALGLLVDRLLARRERRGRTLRAVVLSATLVEGGTWRERVVFREPLADPLRMRLALGPRLALLPAPAETLRLRAERSARRTPAARALFEDERRRARRRGCARRCARRAPPPGPRRRCACSRSTPTRACPSAARC